MPIQRNEMSEKIIITGLVNKPKEFGYSDLALLPDQIKDVSTLAAGREGVGVKLSAIMAVVEPKKDVQYITLEAEGDFAASIPLDAVLDLGKYPIFLAKLTTFSLNVALSMNTSFVTILALYEVM